MAAPPLIETLLRESFAQSAATAIPYLATRDPKPQPRNGAWVSIKHPDFEELSIRAIPKRGSSIYAYEVQNSDGTIVSEGSVEEFSALIALLCATT